METFPDHWRGQILNILKLKTDLHPRHNLMFIFCKQVCFASSLLKADLLLKFWT